MYYYSSKRLGLIGRAISSSLEVLEGRGNILFINHYDLTRCGGVIASCIDRCKNLEGVALPGCRITGVVELTLNTFDWPISLQSPTDCKVPHLSLQCYDGHLKLDSVGRRSDHFKHYLNLQRRRSPHQSQRLRSRSTCGSLRKAVYTLSAWSNDIATVMVRWLTSRARMPIVVKFRLLYDYGCGRSILMFL